MKTELKQIDESNFIEAFNLKLRPSQEEYVSNPVRSLAQAYIYRSQCTPFGVYAEGKMVGYLMVIYDYDVSEYNIWHMMIDAEHQGKGFGRAALLNALEYIKTKPFGDSRRVSLTCHRENLPALKLYADLGFESTGAVFDEEIELAKQI
ncbi:MAG: GNAT family N-acetyltransferase [Oscillospiraceae bacterium]|nr:GNAT family N-acetyltransferase [Oscillospiraceae bacterium]